VKYSKGFKNTVLKKVLPPESRPISEVCKETGVSDQTIRNWLKLLKDDNLNTSDSEISPESRNASEKMTLLLEGRSIEPEKLGQWLRKNGLHTEHLSLWEQELRDKISDKNKSEKQKYNELKKKYKVLEKDLLRKEKALAEAAALLVLKKKANILWGDNEDD
jgi:transposase-like protein